MNFVGATSRRATSSRVRRLANGRFGFTDHTASRTWGNTDVAGTTPVRRTYARSRRTQLGEPRNSLTAIGQ